jgi:hypothetical protein
MVRNACSRRESGFPRPTRSDTASKRRVGDPEVRNLCFDLSERASLRFLIGDRDSKYTKSFDGVLAAEGTTTILPPFRAPTANAFAERWVQTSGGSAWSGYWSSVAVTWSGYWSSVAVTWSGSFASTWLTTTPDARTLGSTCGRLTGGRIPPHRRAFTEPCEGARSWAGSSTSTNSLHEPRSRVSVPLRLAENLAAPPVAHRCHFSQSPTQAMPPPTSNQPLKAWPNSAWLR